jgi:hypothetical protein
MKDFPALHPTARGKHLLGTMIFGFGLCFSDSDSTKELSKMCLKALALLKFEGKIRSITLPV